MVRSGLYGRAGLSIGSADRSSHQPLARAIVRSYVTSILPDSTRKVPNPLRPPNIPRARESFSKRMHSTSTRAKFVRVLSVTGDVYGERLVCADVFMDSYITGINKNMR